MPRTCDVMCASDHVVRFTRPSPSIFAYGKRSKTAAGEGLGTRLAIVSNQVTAWTNTPYYTFFQQTVATYTDTA